jgi:hypothetical protein
VTVPSDAFIAAGEEATARACAVANIDPDSEQVYAEFEGHPSEVVRRMLLGYVEAEDVDSTFEVFNESRKAAVVAMMMNSDPWAAAAGFTMSLAELFIMGVAYGRLQSNNPNQQEHS